MSASPASTPRSTPGARGEELHIGGHFHTIVQHLRTLTFLRSGRISHDHSDASVLLMIFAAAIRIIDKTLSAVAAARTAPPAIGPDRASPSWARSEQLRSMFSVFVCFFWLVRAPPGCTLRSLERGCNARACGPDEPGGDPRGPGGEAQRPGRGYTAWTERATKSPGRVKG